MNDVLLPQRILLIDNRSIDDDSIIQSCLEDISGLQIQTIHNLDHLNQAISNYSFDLVIIHDPLVWRAGLEVVRMLHSCLNCPLIMVTQSSNLEAAVVAMKAGLADYIVYSPLDPTSLVEAVSRGWQTAQNHCDRG